MLLNADIGISQALGFEFELYKYALVNTLQWELDLRKNLDFRNIVATTDFLEHKLFDLRKIFSGQMFDLRKKKYKKC